VFCDDVSDPIAELCGRLKLAQTLNFERNGRREFLELFL
jgi:hypothetical protein